MRFDDISMSFGTQVIYSGASCVFNSNDNVGIVGVNGAGKSTLLKLIIGEYSLDSGKIIIPNGYTIGYLPQVITDEIPSTDVSVFDFLLEGRPIKKLEDEITRLYVKMTGDVTDKELKVLMNKVDKITDKLNYYDQYNAENVLIKIIDGLGISSELLDMKLTDLSGGQKSKVAFARLLYSKANILLLDEPTNHLDKDSKDYIINFLKGYNGLVLVISHDISFLNEVTNKTLYIDKNKHNMVMYNGNYEKYLKIKKERDLANLRLYEKQKAEEEKLQRIVAKYIHGTEKQANIAKDRLKKLEKLQMEKVELEKKNKVTRFKMKSKYSSYLVPIEVKGLSFGYTDDNLLYSNLNICLTRGEKLLIVGENGIGKTTLLKLIMGYLSPNEGVINITEKTNIGYYAQEHELLDLDKTLIDNFNTFGFAEYEIRRFLGNFLFSGEDINKRIKNLSPGERARVALAKLSLSGANTLLLDEPTNHLDPMTQLIISDTFKDFDGTLLVVSHNLDFVDNLGIDRMLLLPSGKIVSYDKNIVLHYENINSSLENI